MWYGYWWYISFKKGKQMIQKDFVIENTILFKYNGDESEVTVPYGITRINPYAFAGYKGLKHIILPRTACYIERAAFLECTSLSSFTFPKNSFIDSDAFLKCTSLETLKIPDTPHKIRSAFYLCDNIRYIEIIPTGEGFLEACPPSWWKKFFEPDLIYITALHNFADDSRLVKYTKRNFEDAFISLVKKKRNDLVKRLLSLKKNLDIDTFDRFIEISTENKNVECTSMLLDMKAAAYTPQKLEKHETENSEKLMGFIPYTLSDVKKKYVIRKENDEIILSKYKGAEKTVFIPGSIGKTQNISIGSLAFADNMNLHEVVVPNEICKMGESVFKNCISLEKVFLSDNVSHIDSGTFENCRMLHEVHFPHNLKTIGVKSFYLCTNLENITLPPFLESIEDYAFGNCMRITTITIPESVTFISYKAFFNIEPTIKCAEGSYAHQYAKHLCLPFLIL
jgi:hypothetical protein